jgi:hypothetical protein
MGKTVVMPIPTTDAMALLLTAGANYRGSHDEAGRAEVTLGEPSTRFRMNSQFPF